MRNSLFLSLPLYPKAPNMINKPPSCHVTFGAFGSICVFFWENGPILPTQEPLHLKWPIEIPQLIFSKSNLRLSLVFVAVQALSQRDKKCCYKCNSNRYDFNHCVCLSGIQQLV